jgi:recombination protein RecA
MAKETKTVLSSKDIQKEFGDDVITIGKDNIPDWGVISTRIPSLDAITGIGGFPKGRIIEIHGMESCFKSTVAMLTAAQYQSEGGEVVYVDAEYTFSAEYAERLGVNVENIILVHPASTEEAFKIIDRFVDTGKPYLFIVDTFTALSPETELENNFGASNMGLTARLNGQFFRKTTAKIGKTGSTLIALNQLREKLGGYVVTKTVPGGNAILFFATMRFEITKQAIKEGTDIKGVTLKVKCIKNKLAIPFLTTEFEAIFGEGIDIFKDLINVAIAKGIVNKAGAGWITYKDTKIQGVDAFKQLLLDNEELKQILEQEVNN